jgi:hypothetical protein
MSEKNGKKPYKKPEVKKVRLDAEVLLVQGCKLSSGQAKGGNQCRAPSVCKVNTAGS